MEELGIAGLDEPKMPSYLDGSIGYETQGGAQNSITGNLNPLPRPGGAERVTKSDVGVNVSFPGEVNKTTIAQRTAKPVVNNGFYPTGKNAGPSSSLSAGTNTLKDQYTNLLSLAKMSANRRMMDLGSVGGSSGEFARNEESPEGYFGNQIASVLSESIAPVDTAGNDVLKEYDVQVGDGTASYKNDGVKISIDGDDFDVNDSVSLSSRVYMMNRMHDMMSRMMDASHNMKY